MAKKKLPENPREYYVHNVDCTLDELARLYEGKKGCSLGNLKKRCNLEKWQEQRDQVYTQTVQKVDEILIEIKATDIANHMAEVGEIFGMMLANIKKDMALMGATIQDGEGFPNKYHLESWKQGLAAYLKPKDEDPNSGNQQAGFVGLPGVDILKC